MALATSGIKAQVTFLESSSNLNIIHQDHTGGGTIVDIDNDFINEIFIINNTSNLRLYKKQGEIYNDMGNYYGINGINNSYLTVAVTDVNLDSLPDFYITGAMSGPYAKLFINNSPGPFTEMSQQYNLNLVTGVGAIFFQISRSRGLAALTGDRLLEFNGYTFVDITSGSGLEGIVNVFCPIFFDIDGDFDDDLFNAGNWELNYGAMFRNNGDGTFTDISTNTNQGGFGFGQEVTFGDIDNDGDFDIYLCSGFGTNSMWQNDGTGFFYNITDESGTGCAGYSRGASFGDFDNDGDLDLFVNRSTAEKILYLNDGSGIFTDVSQQSGVFLMGNGAGCSVGDLNNDGQLDIMAGNCDYQPNFIFINQNSDTNFVKVKVKGRNNNTLALGAIVKLYAATEPDGNLEFMAMREISSHGTFHGNNELVAHFGIRNATKLVIKVYFQSGALAEATGVHPASMVVIEEPELVSNDDPYEELPTRFLTAKAYPNPFNSSTRISLTGGTGDYYHIDIYNILGGKVRSDKISNNDPLTSFYLWDGRDDSGLNVGSGVYLINVRSGNRQTGLKATLLQ